MGGNLLQQGRAGRDERQGTWGLTQLGRNLWGSGSGGRTGGGVVPEGRREEAAFPSGLLVSLNPACSSAVATGCTQTKAGTQEKGRAGEVSSR